MQADSKLQMKMPGKERIAMSIGCFIFATLAFFAPVWPGNSVVPHLGGLLTWVALIEIYDGFRRAEYSSRKSAWASGALSLLMSVILINADLFLSNALYVFIILVFAVDGIRYLIKFLNDYKLKHFYWIDLLAAIGNLLLVLALLISKDKGQAWALSIALCIRMVGIGIKLLSAKTGILHQVSEDVVAALGLSSNSYINTVAEKIEVEEEASAPYDRKWIIIFIVLLFFIHLGRMGFDRSFLGVLSPLVATIGDIVIALAITYIIIGPFRLGFKKISKLLERKLWPWITQVEENKIKKISIRNFVSIWLKKRMRTEIRFRKAGYSFPIAIRTGLRVGLPWSALLAAIMPVLGMSWYFDTENWASGVWDRWAATRADAWRMAITKSTGEGFGAHAFQLHPANVKDTGNFSFMVIGDPGEGDASQLILKDQLIAVSNQPEVKFVVISSDVVYPSGQLKDYEKKFWMPFKGVNKPVYAIPGNHDWYDALDGFIATFYEPAAAKKAMTARVNEDLNISSTTTGKIEEMIAKSADWRKEYAVPTGFQTAPYFQVSTDSFVFISVETGVERQIDSLQRQWLTNVLEASKGKFVMVLLGHPFYAIGEYQGNMNPDFELTHQLLRKYKVPLVMAGDTHDLEYYNEPASNNNNHTMHHFVNGGGGAYLSIGTAMAKPGNMPTKDFAFYPSHDPLVKKITENTSWYKYPAWWWTKKLNGWPFSAEWLSAMFDYNVAPYFQSFMKIKVDAAKKQVTLIPYSNHGRIKWSNMTSTAGARPAAATMNDFAEWVISMQ